MNGALWTGSGRRDEGLDTGDLGRDRGKVRLEEVTVMGKGGG